MEKNSLVYDTQELRIECCMQQSCHQKYGRKLVDKLSQIRAYIVYTCALIPYI